MHEKSAFWGATHTIWSLLIVSLLMLAPAIAASNAETNFYLDLTSKGKVTEQQFREYLNGLSPDQLLLMGKQACQHAEETGKAEECGTGGVVFGIMRAYVQKRDGKPDVSQLFSIMNNKTECTMWKWFVIKWIEEVGHKYLSGEERNHFSQSMENLIKDKTDSPRVRSLSIAILSGLACDSYERALKTDKGDIGTIEEDIRKNASTLLNIVEDYSEASEVIERAMRELGDYWKLNTPVSPQVRESLLRAFESRKQYSPECQVALATVLLLDIGDTGIVAEVRTMRDEVEDKRLKFTIGHLLMRAREAGK